MVKSESRCYKSCQRSHKPAFIPESLLLHLWADTASQAASHSKGRVGPFQRCQGHSRWLRFAAGLGGHCSDPSVNVSAPWKLLAVGDRGEWSILTRKRHDAGSNHKSQTLLKHGFKGTKEMVSHREKSHSHEHEDRGPIYCNISSNKTAYRLRGPVNTWDSLVKCWWSN